MMTACCTFDLPLTKIKTNSIRKRMPCGDFSNVLRQDWLKDLAIADKKKIVESVQVNKSMPCCHGQKPFGTHTKE